MSHKKDRERFRFRKSLDPNYKGFRGPEPKPEPKPELKPMTCSVCQRVKNVPADTPEGEAYVCATCRSSESETAPPGGS